MFGEITAGGIVNTRASGKQVNVAYPLGIRAYSTPPGLTLV